MSADRTGEMLGIDRQQADALALIEQRGWTPARDPLVDNNRSARRGKDRPAFTELLRLIRAGEVDAVVAWNFERLARTARDRLALVEACQEHRAIIALVRGSDIDCSTASGRLTAGVLGEVAEHEIAVKSERQIRANEQAAEQGRRVGGRRPFGYAANGMDVVEREAAAVRRGYADVLAGMPLRAIAGEWNGQGLTSGAGNPWRADSVRNLLLNPRNAGIRSLRHVERGPAVWPALVPEETFRAVVAILTAPGRYTGGTGTAGRQLLSGLGRCGLCDLTVHGGGASHGKPIYRCQVVTLLPDARPKIEGTHVNRLAAPVENYLGQLVVERLRQPDARDALVVDDEPDVTTSLHEQAAGLRHRLDSLAVEFADGELTASQLRAATERLRSRLAEVDAELADVGRVSVLGPLLSSGDIATVWDGLSLDRKRAVISELMVVRLDAVGRGTRTFRPETVRVEWLR